MLKLSKKLKKFIKNKKFLKTTILSKNVVRIPRIPKIPKVTVLKIPKIVSIPKINIVKIPFFSKKNRKYQRFLNKRKFQPKTRKKQIDYITSEIARLKMELYKTLGRKEIKIDRRIISGPHMPESYKEIINKKEAEKIIDNKITILELEEEDKVENITIIDKLKDENNEILDVLRDMKYGGEYKTKEGNISEKEMVEDFGGIHYDDMSDSLKNMFENYTYAYFDDDLSKAINFYEEAIEFMRNK